MVPRLGDAVGDDLIRMWASDVNHRLFFAAIIAGAVLYASYDASPNSPSVSATVDLPSIEPVEVSAAQVQKLNVDDIFPQGVGLYLMLQSCTNCHEVSLFAILRKSADAWARIRANHARRFPALTDAEIESMYEYVVANFNPDRPPSKVPPAL